MLSKSNTYKVAIVGEAGIGKSSIIDRIVRKCFDDSPRSTIGAAYASYKYNNNIYQIWDTAGQERYKALIPMYLKDSKVIIMVYDISNLHSIKCIQDYWYNFVLDNVDETCYKILIGNKLDLYNLNVADSEEVKSVASSFSESNNLFHILVSAKEGTNIDDIFRNIDQQLQTNKDNSSCNDYEEDEYPTGSGLVPIDWEFLKSNNETFGCSGCVLQ